MTPEDSLKLILSKLDEYAIPYMITGSFASNIHGLPRATQDADLVIEAEPKRLERFLESLDPGFYRSVEAAMEALAREQMFNIIHLETGFKVDLIVRKSRPFSRIEFSRRQAAFYLGENRWFATAEDIILAKLEWSKVSGSERQFSDALSVAKLQKENLDQPYLEKWARELGISDLLQKNASGSITVPPTLSIFSLVSFHLFFAQEAFLPRLPLTRACPPKYAAA